MTTHQRKPLRTALPHVLRVALAVGVIVVVAIPVLSSEEAPAAASAAYAASPTRVTAPARVVGGPNTPLLPARQVHASLLPAELPTVNPDRLVDWPALVDGSFPAVPANSGEGRRAVYSKTEMRVWMIEADGSVVAAYSVSGKRSMPSPGSYKVYSRSRYAVGGEIGSGITMEYMVRFAFGVEQAIGFHSIPMKGGRPLQSEAQLGQALSAGCIRQLKSDAERMWEFAPIGTPVIVVV